MITFINKKVLLGNLVKKGKTKVIKLPQLESILLFQKIRKKISLKPPITIIIIKTIIEMLI